MTDGVTPSDSPPADDPVSPALHEGSATRRKVGLSDAAVATDGAVLVTSGLGSCLGVAFYDPTAGVGGLLHAMLPESGDRPGADEKFVVDGIDALIGALAAAGADPDGLQAKVAGAAEMIEFGVGDDTASVGERNVAAAEAALAGRGIPLVAADTGGGRGRSLRFETDSGSLHVSYAGGETVVL